MNLRLICERCQEAIPLPTGAAEVLCACGTRMYRVGDGPRWESGLERAVRAQGEATSVTSPAYYRRGGIEVDDAIQAWGLSYRLGSVLGYIVRAGHKTPDPLDDLRKAREFLDREIRMHEKARA